jgi:hypothetical protein
MRYLPLLAILLLAVTANADDGEQRVHVNLDDVVAAGEVKPVNGITSCRRSARSAL